MGSSGQEEGKELYQDLAEYSETKRKIEALIKFKQSLIDQEHSDFTSSSAVFAQYKLQALDAINRHFDAFRTSGI